MSPLETPALYDARPAVAIDGTEQPELRESLLSVVVHERTDGLFRCEATFGNWGTTADGRLGYILSDRRLVDFGSELSVQMGAGDKAGEVFSGVVTGLEVHCPAARAPELVVLAEDHLQDLRMTRRTRTFDEMSDADVITRIAQEHGLRAAVDVDGPQHRVLAQVAQSDLAFVRDRARSVGAELWVSDGTINAVARDRRGGEPVRLVYGANLLDASVLADLAHQRTSLSVTGWDVSTKAAVSSESTASSVASELEGGESGVAILERALGARPEVVTGLLAHNDAEARAAADACMRSRARRFCTGRVSAQGDARVRVGARVELVGLGPGFEGVYAVVEASHLFDGTSGYRVDLRVERPALGTGGR